MQARQRNGRKGWRNERLVRWDPSPTRVEVRRQAARCEPDGRQSAGTASLELISSVLLTLTC